MREHDRESMNNIGRHNLNVPDTLFTFMCLTKLIATEQIIVDRSLVSTDGVFQ